MYENEAVFDVISFTECALRVVYPLRVNGNQCFVVADPGTMTCSSGWRTGAAAILTWLGGTGPNRRGA
jgi:hypothetical protein